MTDSQGVKLMGALSRAFPRQEMHQETIELYVRMLKDLDELEARRAVARIMTTAKYFPTIAEILGEAAKAMCASIPPAEAAWGLVLKAISKVGVHRVPRFKCPVMALAVASIGWRDLCLAENVTSTRARFIEAYRVFRVQVVESKQQGRHALPEATDFVKGLLGGCGT